MAERNLGFNRIINISEKYTVGQILKAVERELSPTDCVSESGNQCENKGFCVSFFCGKNLIQLSMMCWNELL